MEVGIGSLPFVEDLRKIAGGTSINERTGWRRPQRAFSPVRGEPDLSYAEEDLA